MPVISQFYGILIYMYREIGGHHKEPHIHVKYNEYVVSVNFKCKILDGKLPNKQKKLLQAWIVLHEEELKAAWHAYQIDGETIKIKGLE